MTDEKDIRFELAGVISEENFPLIRQYFDGRTVHTDSSQKRKTPTLFKDLPPGTELYIKVVNR